LGIWERLTSLSTGDNVITFVDGCQGVALNRRGDGIASKANVGKHDGVESSIVKAENRLDTNSTLLDNVDGGDTAKG
jgi:hypothetical protein